VIANLKPDRARVEALVVLLVLLALTATLLPVPFSVRHRRKKESGVQYFVEVSRSASFRCSSLIDGEHRWTLTGGFLSRDIWRS